MKLEGYREAFYTYSAKASDISRQLGFAGIAVIWLFKVDQSGQLTVPRSLIVSGILIILSLALDLLHYCVGALIWRFFYINKENNNVSEDSDIQHSVWLERPIYALFGAKIICMVAAYIGILIFLIGRLSISHGA